MLIGFLKQRKKRKMIVINKNTTTNFVATLFELSQLTNQIIYLSLRVTRLRLNTILS